MTKKISEPFSKKKQVSQAPPASGGVRGQLPIPPTGKVIKVNQLTPSERQMLEQHGLTSEEGSFPENLAEIIEAAKSQATDINRMPPPTSMDTPPVQVPELVDISELPEHKREEYKNIIKNVVAEATEHAKIQEQSFTRDPSVNEAIKTAMGQGKQIILEDDVKHDKVGGSDIPKEKFTAPSNRETPALCPRCGFDVHEKDPIEVTDSDKLLFIESVISGKPMFKTYSLLGGNLIITVRSLSIEEADAVMLQVYIDSNNDRIVTYYDKLETINKYRTCLQIANIEFPTEAIALPKHMDDWDVESGGKETVVYYIWEKFRKIVDKTDLIHHILVDNVVKFNQLQSKLEVNASNPNFWKATG